MKKSTSEDEICPACHGAGIKWPHYGDLKDLEICEVCDGEGVI